MRRRAAPLLIAAPFAVLVLAFFLFFELHRSERDTGWSLAAYRDPFLAAREFLQHVGLPAQTLEGLPADTVFSTAGTVYVSQPNQVLTSVQVQRLLRWIEAGGHLVLVADAHDNHERLLEHFDLEIGHTASGCGCKAPDSPADPNVAKGAPHLQPDADDAQEAAPEPTVADQLREYNEELRRAYAGDADGGAPDPDTARADPGTLTRLTFDGVDGEMRIDLGTEAELLHPSLRAPEDAESVEMPSQPPLYYAGSDTGIHFMQFATGDGLVSVIAGQNPFTNATIGEFDHAFLLWTLTGGEGEALFLHGARSPALWRLAWKHFPELLITGALLLGAALWRRAPRFGPILETRDSGRRGIDEHLRACANYLWQQGAGDALVAPLRKTTEERARHRFANFAALQRAEKIALLSRHCTLPESLIESALYGAVPATPAQFLQHVKTLKTLGEDL